MVEDSASEDDEDESIEASIARELAELKQAGHKGKGKATGKPKGPKPRFQSVETSTECCEFISLGASDSCADLQGFNSTVCCYRLAL